MPICQMKTNHAFTSVEKRAFLSETAEMLAVILHKPLPAVMVMLDSCDMMMNGTDEETVFFAEFRYVADFETAEERAAFQKDFADRMLSLIQQHTNVDPYRIYMQFTEMPRDSAWRYLG